MNKQVKTPLIHFTLFILTLITTTFAGAEWIGEGFFPYNLTLDGFFNGLNYSIPLLLALTVHEFGHYFAAKFYKVKVTLPYYLPVWFGFIGLPSFGTFGAVIRIKEAIVSRKVFFDIGIAGPIAGFVIALGILFYGFTNLPPQDYIYQIHPEYKIFGENYAEVVYDTDTVIYKKELSNLPNSVMEQLPDTIAFNYGIDYQLGDNLLFKFFKTYVTQTPERVPNQHEIIHYPWIFAGYLVLFFTAINLLPIGQLDGGHVLYGLVGAKYQKIISAILFMALVFYAGLGIIDPYATYDTFAGISFQYFYIVIYVLFLYYVFFSIHQSPKTRFLIAISIFTIQYLLAFIYKGIEGYVGWMVFAFLIGRFIGVYHPKALVDEPLDGKRKLLGIIALIIFIISFSPRVFDIPS